MLAGEVALHLGRHSHAEGSRDGGGTVAGAEGVVGAFAHLWEAADAAIGADGLEGFAAAGQYFVGIGLMPHIPDEFVVGCVEDIVEGYSELDGAEARGQVAGMGREGVNDICTQFVGNALQFVRIELFEVGGTVDVAKSHCESIC